MVDFVEITAVGGSGGDGIGSFRREKYVPKGGPDGGDGGDGGNVVLVANSALSTLGAFRSRRVYGATRGGHGRGKRQHGKRGADLVLQVPAGTTVTRRGAGVPEEVLALIKPGQAVVIARGGKGGRGNCHFATPTNQAPYLAEAGEVGETSPVILELKLLADVAIIGLPNAGKSTLLAAASAARPKVAAYPFTTTEPVLGVATVGWRDVVLMEVPGLIEGAHEGSGLGDTFLRHAERSRLFIHLLDGLSPDLGADWRAVNRELALYRRELVEKPQVIVVNKIDVPEARDHFLAQCSSLEALGYPALAISAVTGEGVPTLLREVASRLPPLLELPPVQEELERLPREPHRVVVTRDGPVFVVQAERAERLAKRSDLRRWEGLVQFRQELARLSVAEALARAGAQPGDRVRVGRVEIEWT